MNEKSNIEAIIEKLEKIIGEPDEAAKANLRFKQAMKEQAELQEDDE